MLRIPLAALVVLYVFNCVESNRISSEKAIHEPNRNSRLIEVISGDSPRFRQWPFIYLPSLPSVGSFFRDDDASVNSLKRRVDALEKTQKELLGLLQQAKEAGRTETCNCQKEVKPENLESKKDKSYQEINNIGAKGTPSKDIEKAVAQSTLIMETFEKKNATMAENGSTKEEDILLLTTTDKSIQKLQEQLEDVIALLQEGNHGAPDNHEEGKNQLTHVLEKSGNSKTAEGNAGEISIAPVKTSDRAILVEATDSDNKETTTVATNEKDLKEANAAENSSTENRSIKRPKGIYSFYSL